MFDSYFRQSFSLPDTVIYYITQKPSSPKGYQKLIQTCKYFFTKNPILVFHCLDNLAENDLETCYKNQNNDCVINKMICTENTVSKYWITERLYFLPIESAPTNIASNFILKLYKCDISFLCISRQSISVEELKAFATVKELILNETTVTSEIGSLTPLENIIECLPKLIDISYMSDGFITKNTMKELEKIPHFHKMQYMGLQDVPEAFDIENFYEYLKISNYTIFSLSFTNSISEGYRNRLDKIIDEILETEYPSHFKIPYINFPGINPEKENILDSRNLENYRFL